MGESNIQHKEFDRSTIPTVFKNIDSSDCTVTPFIVNKTWTILSGSSTASCLPLTAIYTDINYLPALGTELIYNDDKNIDGSLQSVTYFSINKLFYKNKQNLYNQLGSDDINLNRTLYTSASILSFPYKKIGIEIKPQSFTLQSATSSLTFNMSADKYGNIHDLQLNSNRIISKCKLYEGFNEYFDLSRISNSTDLNNIYTLRDRYITGSIGITDGIRTTSGQQKPIGHSAEFTGNGYIVVPNDFILGSYGFNDNYAISFFISASSTGTGYQSVINKFDKQGPYDIRVLPNKRIGFYIHGNTYDVNSTPHESSTISIESTTAVSSNWNHVVCQKSGSRMQIYVNGVLEAEEIQSKLTKSNSPFAHVFNINTTADLKIGGVGFVDTSLNFTGKLDEVRLYNKALTSTQIDYLRDLHETGSMLQTTQCGNIYNKHGIAVITSPNYIYDNILQTQYTASFKSTITKYELSTIVRIPADEFNLTTNRTLLQDDLSTFKTFATSSNFDPYFTTIGLYNESAQLVAIGKLAYPVKKRGDVDMNVMIRLDLDMNIK